MKDNSKIKQTRAGAGRKPISPNGEKLDKKILITFTQSEYDSIMKAKGKELMTSFLREIIIKNISK